MKFGKYLDSKANPAWRQHYLDYKVGHSGSIPHERIARQELIALPSDSPVFCLYGVLVLHLQALVGVVPAI
jgi:hypothetical protein